MQQFSETQQKKNMKEKVLSYSIISFVLLNIWTLYVFFNYFTEKDNMFHGLSLLYNFAYSLLYAVGLGCILLIVRLILHLKKKTYTLKSNFFYILSGIFNLNNFIIWLICMVLKILNFDNDILAYLAIGSFLISSFIIIDIYKSVFRIDKTVA